MIAESINDLIGNTPLVRIRTLCIETGATVLGKCEFLNPTSSVKDRIAQSMIEGALQRGEIDKHTVIIEPTSGNTGIGLAAVCAAKGLKLLLTMPESMSIERRKLLTYLGAEVVLTPANEGMQGAIDKARRLKETIGNAVILQQFQNLDNPRAHTETTAREILDDLGENIDAFVAAVGTGGTLSGTAKVLKKEIPRINVVAVEPKNSAVLHGRPPGPHKIQGIGAGFIPDVLNTTLIDEIVDIDDNDAFRMARRIAREEGLLVGISSGANLEAARRIASRPEFKGKTIVTVLCDTAERYLSTELFDL